MKILILNGNGFIGSEVADCLHTAGHQVDVFHRSNVAKTAGDDVHHIIGDRNIDLSALSDQHWDCTIDFGALQPGQVSRLAQDGLDKWGHYVLVSSTEVYEPPTSYGFNEFASLRQSDQKVGNPLGSYGYRKALCELEAQIFPLRTIIRPTYVIGRSDPTSRFNRWVQRICDGGKVLIPRPSNLPFQAVDVRDVANFVTKVVGDSTAGIYQLTAPFPPISFIDALKTIRDLAPRKCIFMEISISDLVRLGTGPFDMPLWPGWNEPYSEESGDPSLAISVGFHPRAIEESISWLVDGFLAGAIKT
jgi:2'-hydroxyisoflavone reductase